MVTQTTSLRVLAYVFVNFGMDEEFVHQARNSFPVQERTYRLDKRIP